VLSCATFARLDYGHAFDTTPCCCLIVDDPRMLVAFCFGRDASIQLVGESARCVCGGLSIICLCRRTCKPLPSTRHAPPRTRHDIPYMYCTAVVTLAPDAFAMHASMRCGHTTSPSGDASQTRRRMQVCSLPFIKQEKRRLCPATSDSSPLACGLHSPVSCCLYVV
jgi:hypothetical protein